MEEPPYSNYHYHIRIIQPVKLPARPNPNNGEPPRRPLRHEHAVHSANTPRRLRRNRPNQNLAERQGGNHHWRQSRSRSPGFRPPLSQLLAPRQLFLLLATPTSCKRLPTRWPNLIRTSRRSLCPLILAIQHRLLRFLAR